MSLDAYSQAEDKQRIKDEQGKEDDINQLAFFDQQEDIKLSEQTIWKTSEDISDFAIFDSDQTTWDGTDDNDKWVSDTSIGTIATDFVISSNNLFRENFLDTIFKDDSNTTSTWNTSGTLTFGTDEDAVSTQIYKDNTTNIQLATIDITTTSTSYTAYMKCSSGYSWEVVTSGTEHTFTSSGTELYFKISDSDSTIDNIQIRY